MKRLIILLAPLLFITPAQADTPAQGLQQVNRCLNTESDQACLDALNSNSHSLYNRFKGEDVLHCVPAPLVYDSEEESGEYRIVRGYVQDDRNDKKRYFRLWMAQENNQWKLDAPATLHAALGPDWQKQINTTEQIYQMAKMQFGTKINCNALTQILRTQTDAKL